MLTNCCGKPQHFPRCFAASAKFRRGNLNKTAAITNNKTTKRKKKILCEQEGSDYIVASCRAAMDERSWHLLFSAFAACLGLALSSDLCYNHQTQTYDARFKPASNCEDMCTVTPYFSPDHSLDTYISLIESATETIDIYTPGQLHVLCLRSYTVCLFCACFVACLCNTMPGAI